MIIACSICDTVLVQVPFNMDPDNIDIGDCNECN